MGILWDEGRLWGCLRPPLCHLGFTDIRLSPTTSDPWQCGLTLRAPQGTVPAPCLLCWVRVHDWQVASKSSEQGSLQVGRFPVVTLPGPPEQLSLDWGCGGAGLGPVSQGVRVRQPGAFLKGFKSG